MGAYLRRLLQVVTLQVVTPVEARAPTAPYISYGQPQPSLSPIHEAYLHLRAMGELERSEGESPLSTFIGPTLGLTFSPSKPSHGYCAGGEVLTINVQLPLTNAQFPLAAECIANLPCPVNYILNIRFWTGTHYCCQDKSFAKLFQYLNCPELFYQCYPSEPEDELGVDCELYAFGRKYQWTEISEAAGCRIREYWPGNKYCNVCVDALTQARDTKDGPMYAFLMARFGFPVEVLPPRSVPSSPMRLELPESPGSARTVIEDEPSQNISPV